MPESHVISALVSKRSDILGKITHHRQLIKKLKNDLMHIDTTIKIFNPDYDLRQIRPKQYRQKNKHFKQGERANLVLDILRVNEKPLDTESIANIIAKYKGIEDDITKTIRNSLIVHFRNGIVKRKRSKRGSYLWSLNS